MGYIEVKVWEWRRNATTHHSINQSIEWKTETQNPIAFLTVKPSTPRESVRRREKMSIWNYVVTAHKPTNVTHSCVGNFTSPQDLNLILASVFPPSLSFRVLFLFLLNFWIHFFFIFFQEMYSYRDSLAHCSGIAGIYSKSIISCVFASKNSFPLKLTWS